MTDKKKEKKMAEFYDIPIEYKEGTYNVTIIALAMEASSVEEYPYADVMVGELVK